MKFVTIVGARPQFIKAKAVSDELRKNGHEEIIIHTGQHYDENMSKVFFDEMKIPKPDYNLGINSISLAEQTGRMITEIGGLLEKHRPDAVIVYGDTTSTIAGAIAAKQCNLKLIHVEAGMRSFDKSMPEELNRVVTDHLSDVLFCSTDTAVNNLEKENIKKNVFNIGDLMYDTLLEFEKIASKDILKNLDLNPKEYLLATVHRQSNTDNVGNLKNILEGFKESGEKIIFPVHPRTANSIKKFGLDESPNVMMIPPTGYLEMITLSKNAKKILTDSGGLQKEAFLLGVPCITLRESTEWVETVENEWNILVGPDKEKIVKAIREFNPSRERKNFYGDGAASSKMRMIIESCLNKRLED